MIFGVTSQQLLGQLLLGLINGAFYALLSLGLAVIFGMLNIINFAHGALFMLGAFAAWMMVAPNAWLAMISPGLAVPDWLSLGYWPALIVAPLSTPLVALAIGAIAFAVTTQRQAIGARLTASSAAIRWAKAPDMRRRWSLSMRTPAISMSASTATSGRSSVS